jgi:molecular chaperone GrpE
VMTHESQAQPVAAEDEQFSAAAPPHPGAAGTGETSFGDAEAPPASEAPSEDEGAPAAADPLTDVERQRDEYLALAQRKQAEFENFRKRAAREKAAATERGAADLAKALLPALDHLELALKAAEGHEDVIKGFAMVAGEITAALNRAGIQAFSPKGEPFDPNEHEAMVSQPAEGCEPGTVVEVYQSGYRINGTVLRPARVVVAA